MSLDDWRKNGWVKPHQPTRQEVVDLLALANRDLKNAKVAGLDDDWRFSIAYNAMLQAGAAALTPAGYAVPKGDSHHFRVIQSLAFTVGLDAARVATLDLYRKKRSTSIYDVAGAITDAEAKAMRALSEDVVKRVRAWLTQAHPSLLK